MHTIGTIFHNWMAIGRRGRHEDSVMQALLPFTRFLERVSGGRVLERAAGIRDLEALLLPLEPFCNDMRLIGSVPRLHYAAGRRWRQVFGNS